MAGGRRSSPACASAWPGWAWGFWRWRGCGREAVLIDDATLLEEIAAPASRVILHAEGRGSRELRAGDAGHARLATAPAALAVRLAGLESRPSSRGARARAGACDPWRLPGRTVAQISVALHFYHPLAHWLAKRLRLEQELAADAWGAALSGGSPTYLDDARPDGAQTRRPQPRGTGPCFSPITWHSCYEDRNAAKYPCISAPARCRSPLAPP